MELKFISVKNNQANRVKSPTKIESYNGMNLNEFMTTKDRCVKMGSTCLNKIFKNKLCKKHYFDDIKLEIIDHMRKIYRIPDVAFSEIDFSGKGYITEDDFFKGLIKQMKYSKEELKEYFDRENSFKRKITEDATGMNFEIFKRSFFPSEALRYENPMKRLVATQDETAFVKNDDDAKRRMKNLEGVLKKKFENNWISVRKAFLDLDLDYDGYIKPEDIARYFQNDSSRVDFNVLK